jgi:CHAT domain-containing protein/tetratricopeptide (TPR) repeat protein
MTSLTRAACWGAGAAVLCAGTVGILRPHAELVLAERALNALPASGAVPELRAAGQRWLPGSETVPDVRTALASTAEYLDYAESRLGRTALVTRLRARVLLLAGQYDEAIAQVRLARSIDPADANTTLTLGLAFAARGFAEARPADYGVALEAFAAAGADAAVRAEAYCDLAWVLEQIPAPHTASQYWRKALAEEPARAWRAQIERRQASMSASLDRRARLIQDTVDRALPDAPAAGTRDLLIQRALTMWLADAARFSSEIQRLAAYLRESRRDPWLSELTAGEAGKLLASAAAANLDGHNEAARLAAQAARSAYLTIGNRAGILAASVEKAYAHARLSQPAECLESLRDVREQAHRASYRWLENRAWFEEITCKTQSRSVDVMAERIRAAREIPLAGYDALGLRAAALLAAPFNSLTTPGDAWQNAHLALRSYWESVLPGILASNLYVPLALASATAGNLHAADLLFDEAIAALDGYPNVRLKAQVWSDAAAAHLRAGDLDQAAVSYRKAADLFPSTKESEGTAQLADVTLAEFETRSGKTAQALQRLARLGAGNPFPYSSFGYYVRLGLLPAYGEALMASGDVPGAMKHYRQATEESLERLRPVQNRAQRQTLLRESEVAWRGLVATQLRNGDRLGALDSWQMFRSGRDPRYLRTETGADAGWLSYACLPDGVAVWFADSRGVEYHSIAGRDLPRVAERLAMLLGSPDSPPELIHDISRQLYRALIAPVASRAAASRVLVIDADGPLAVTPWAALEDDAGACLLEHHALVQSHGWHEAASRTAATRFSLEPAVIVSDPALDTATARRLPRLVDAAREADEIHRRFPAARVLTGAQANVEQVLGSLAGSRLFHFAGHGLANGGFGALVLAGENDVPSSLLTAQRISQLDLSSLELVVLSACSAAVGESSGALDLDSLVRSFLEGGAARVLSARWNIDSRRTAALMDRFYDGLAAGSSAAEALRTAALALRHQSETRHPYYWAAFQLYGSL